MNSPQNTMTALEIDSFNDRFTFYEGKKKTKSQVSQLLKTIASSNSVNHNKIAVKLSGLSGYHSVYDSCKYVILDENKNLIKCGAGNIVSLDEIIDYVDGHKSYNYTVTLYYCNQKTQSVSNNKELNPHIGCVLLVHISKK